MSGLRLYFGGGLSELDTMSASEAWTDGGGTRSYNFALSPYSSRLQSRDPFYTLSSTLSSSINGLAEYYPRSGTPRLFFNTAQGITYYRLGSSTFTAGTCHTSSRLRGTHWDLDDYMIVTDLEKATAVSKFNGTTFSTLTTGLGATLYAKYALVHLGRVWLFNVKTTTDTPHLLVASAFENPTSYDTTNRAGSATFTSGTEAFYMTTPDLREINGVVKFYDTLVISTKGGALYRLTGSDSTDFAWTPLYSGSCALHEESMVVAGDDIYYVREGGSVESVKSTDRFGDVSGDDVSKWIPTLARSFCGNSLYPAMSVYDPKKGVVLFIPRLWPTIYMLAMYVNVLKFGAPGERGERQQLSPWSFFYEVAHVSQLVSCAIYSRNLGGIVAGMSDGKLVQLTGASYALTISNTVNLSRMSRVFDASYGIDPRKPKSGYVRYTSTTAGTAASASTQSYYLDATYEHQTKTRTGAPSSRTTIGLYNSNDGSQYEDMPMLVSPFELGGQGEFMRLQWISAAGSPKPHFHEIAEIVIK